MLPTSSSRAAALALLLSIFSRQLAAQDGVQSRPAATIVATRAAAPPQIDGRPDDPVWSTAASAADFRTFAPSEGATPTFRTDVRVLYDDRALYVLVRAYDAHPDSIVRRLARRDSDGPPNDQIQLFIDSYHDRRSGFEYIVNAAGVKSDYLLFDDTGFDQSWNGVWDAATSVDSLGWVAEYAIPLQQLRFTDRRTPTFGIMVWRLVGRLGERVSLPAYRRSAAGLVSQFGALAGVRDLARSASVELAPYALARARNVAASGPGAPARVEATPSLGGDLRWLPRPSVSVDATINPDFGQVEADPAVLDLSGLEVFQAERRPFFLEGAGLLAFPLARDGSSPLFYSRRIGRAPRLAGTYGAPDSPGETTILGASKVTARMAPTTSLVALGALTQQELGARRDGEGDRWLIEPRSAYGVARLQHDLRGGRSGVGLMATTVDRATGDSVVARLLPSSARALAVTSQHQTRDGTYRADAWVAVSRVAGDTGAIGALQRSAVHLFQRPDDRVEYDPSRSSMQGAAWSASMARVAGTARWSASYRSIAPGFDVNELGYLTKAGVQDAAVTAGLVFDEEGRVAGLAYRRAAVTLGFDGEWAMDGLPFGRAFSLATSVQLPGQAEAAVTVRQQLTGGYCAATCTRGGPALVDPPRSTVTAHVMGDPRRVVVPRLDLEWNRDDEGRSRGVGGLVEVTWRLRSNLDASFGAYAFDALYDTYFHGRDGDPLSDTADVRMARLAWPTRSITARFDLAATRTLSIQWYAQAYVSRGEYTNLRDVAQPRAARYEERFRPSDSDVPPAAFDFKQLRANAVVRWEYRPGSTLFVVWSQARDHAGEETGSMGLWPGADLRALWGLRPSNVLTVKATYWLVR